MNTFDIPFHQFQRYKMAEILINIFRNGNEAFKILEVGANEHKNLGKFLQNDSIIYSDISLSDIQKKDPSFIEADATQLKFDDQSYDFIVALDVMEHIPQSMRKLFLSETYRVSKRGTIISAPFLESGIEDSERRVSIYFEALYNKKILWSEEHKLNGLPSLTETLKYINEQISDKIFTINHGNINLWERLITNEFLSGVHNDAYTYWKEINAFYNKELFHKDFSDKSVRTFIIIPKGNNYVNSLNKNLENIAEKMDEEDTNKLQVLERNYMNLLLMNSDQEHNEDCYSQLYFETKSGFDEENSIVEMLPTETSNHSVKVTFPVEGLNLQRIRVDPINKSCFIRLKNFMVIDIHNNKYPVQVHDSNAELNEGDNYLFLSNDPQFFIHAPKDNLSTISVEFEYWNIESVFSEFMKKNIYFQEETKRKLDQLITTNELLEQRIANFTEISEAIHAENKLLENKIIDLEQKLAEQIEKNRVLSLKIGQIEESYRYNKETIDYIKNHISWKLAKPIRILSKFDNTKD